MYKLAKKTCIRLVSSIAIFIIFAYMVVAICSIPRDFTVSFSKGKLISSYSLKDISTKTNTNITSLVSGNLTNTFKGKNQWEILTEKLGKTLILLISGILLGIVLGIIKGIFDSRKGTIKDSHYKVLLTIIPMSFPDLLVIAVLQGMAIWLSKHNITIFKVAGHGTINHTLLPIIALSILPASYIARVTALSIESCYNMDYVKVAMGKGCSKTRILWNHVMRNALSIISEGLSSITSLIICNLLIVEFMFSYMGLAVTLVQFCKNNDIRGMVVVIIILGAIYFILDGIFQFTKKFVFQSLKEENI